MSQQSVIEKVRPHITKPSCLFKFEITLYTYLIILLFLGGYVGKITKRILFLFIIKLNQCRCAYLFRVRPINTLMKRSGLDGYSAVYKRTRYGQLLQSPDEAYFPIHDLQHQVLFLMMAILSSNIFRKRKAS